MIKLYGVGNVMHKEHRVFYMFFFPCNRFKMGNASLARQFINIKYNKTGDNELFEMYGDNYGAYQLYDIRWGWGQPSFIVDESFRELL